MGFSIQDKKEEYDEKEESGYYFSNSDQEKEDRNEISTLMIMAGLLVTMFIVFLGVGGVLLATERRSKGLLQQTIIIQNTPNDTSESSKCSHCGGMMQTGWKLCPNCGRRKKG